MAQRGIAAVPFTGTGEICKWLVSLELGGITNQDASGFLDSAEYSGIRDDFGSIYRQFRYRRFRADDFRSRGGASGACGGEEGQAGGGETVGGAAGVRASDSSDHGGSSGVPGGAAEGCDGSQGGDEVMPGVRVG